MALDISNQKFGRLTPLYRVSIGRNRRVWLCKCDCGKDALVSTNLLTSEKTKSCGCYRSEIASSRRTHGMSATREWNIWSRMIQRCFNPKVERYKNYGGRGITVCKKWRDFEGFYKDMGKVPDGFSLERIDVNGNYEPSNCKWIPLKDQHKNTTKSVLITHNGMTKNAVDWARELGIKASTIYYRSAKGLPPAAILGA